MSAVLKEFFCKPSAQDFSQYTRNIQPPLDTQRLDMHFLVGAERTGLQTPTNGDSSFVVVYESKGKKKEGAVSSLIIPEGSNDLVIVQLQGARGKGYRVSTGLRWIDLFADQIHTLASHPETPIKRITLPDLLDIEGLPEAPETAIPKYELFVNKLGLHRSQTEGQYVKDVK